MSTLRQTLSLILTVVLVVYIGLNVFRLATFFLDKANLL